MTAFPPVRFSTMTACFRISLVLSAAARATTSPPPPGGNGITNRTVRDGQSACARAFAVPSTAAATVNCRKARLFIDAYFSRLRRAQQEQRGKHTRIVVADRLRAVDARASDFRFARPE